MLMLHIGNRSDSNSGCFGSNLKFFVALQSKRDDVTGDWRKLHNDELHNCTPRQT
jgi:hypothetical protein